MDIIWALEITRLPRVREASSRSLAKALLNSQIKFPKVSADQVPAVSSVLIPSENSILNHLTLSTGQTNPRLPRFSKLVYDFSHAPQAEKFLVEIAQIVKMRKNRRFFFYQYFFLVNF